MNWLVQHLRELMDKQKLTVQSVASQVGVERAYLSQILHGTRVPSEDLVRRLARFFQEDEEEWAFQTRGAPVLERLHQRFPRHVPAYARRLKGR